MVPSFEHAYSKSELRPLGLEHTATPVHCDSLDAPTGLVGLDVGQSKHVFVLNAPIVLESMDFPDPVIGIAIEPKTQSDVDKLGLALNKLAEEDPTFKVKTDENY